MTGARASIYGAIKEIAMAYQKQSGAEITTLFGASSTLALKIEKMRLQIYLFQPIRSG